VLLVAATARGEEPFAARVVRIADGDSFTVKRGSSATLEEIRIFGIDAPERGQPWSRHAREALSERVFGKVVRIEPVDRDRHQRIVAHVYADDVCVGCELLREGHVWAYRRYADSARLLALEAEARAARRGLWALPEQERVPPWDWRHGEREAGAASAEPSGFACGAKTYYRETESCAEARFHRERCGLARLDRDGDGVPCESLCAGTR
jgi:endonuclease YncB( thermonuclease family)